MNNISENSTAYKLRKCRENCGLSQQAVARALGIDRTTYTYYENGRSQPNLNTLVKISGLFCVDPSSLLPSESVTTSLRDTDNDLIEPIYSLAKDEQNLLLSYRMLSDEQKSELLAKITNMTKDDK